MAITTTGMEHLPEEVFVHILSFLPTFDAIKVCSLSHKWRNLWQLNPNLEFDIFFFDYHFKYKNYSPRQIRSRFAGFVSRTLHRLPRHSPPPHKFHLLFDDTNPIQADVDSWLLHAINLNVREIHLDFDITYHKFSCDYTTRNYYDSYGIGDDRGEVGEAYLFNISYLVNTSVEVLKLRGCYLSFPTLTPIRVESLKYIHLMDFGLEDYEVTQLLSICVNLESLHLQPVWGFNHLKIVSPTLKELKLCYLLEDDVENRSLEIDAPCLRSITLISFCVGKYIWKCIPSLVEAHVEFESIEESTIACWMKMLGLITGVQRLTTQNMWISSQYGKMDKSMCCDDEMSRKKPKLEGNEVPSSAEKDFCGKHLTGNNICLKNIAFNNLKYLELLTGYTKEDMLGLEIVFGNCPRLESVDLVYSYHTFMDEFLEQEMEERPIILHLPCLRLVKMKKFRSTPNELYVVGLLKNHGVVLEKIVAFPAKIDDELFPAKIVDEAFVL